jgi:ribosomal protein S18 acetylase RimI-like enzyme
MVRVEQLGAGDWSRLRQVRLGALAADPAAFGSTYDNEYRQPESFWRARLQSAAWFVAIHGDEPVGLVACVAATAGDHERQLDAMWVAPAWRGRGVGESLARAVITCAEAGGAVAVSLTVADGNDHARRLYERLGFNATGHREPRPRDPSIWRERLRLSLIE